jgi:hypothetical protein
LYRFIPTTKNTQAAIANIMMIRLKIRPSTIKLDRISSPVPGFFRNFPFFGRLGYEGSLDFSFIELFSSSILSSYYFLI